MSEPSQEEVDARVIAWLRTIEDLKRWGIIESFEPPKSPTDHGFVKFSKRAADMVREGKTTDEILAAFMSEKN
jgi:hypothetical protein